MAEPPNASDGEGDDALVGVTSIASGAEDFALAVDGTGQYATADDDSVFDVTDAITIEAWVKPTSTCSSSECMVVNKESAYEVAIFNGSFHYALQGGSSWTYRNTTVVPAVGEWQHIALTRAAGANVVHFYLNGQLAFTGTADGAGTGPISNSNLPFTVGGRSGSPPFTYHAFFPGSIDEVRLFNVARDATEIRNDMHTHGPVGEAGLVAYYDFNEGPSGTTGTGTIYNRVTGATGATNLRTVGGPTYVDIAQTTSNGNNTVVTFPRSYLTAAGGWRVPEGVSSVDTLIVGGGGGGGYGVGGGGGAGLFLEKSNYSLVDDVLISSIAPVQVGAGGLGGTASRLGSNGQESTFGSLESTGGGSGGNNRSDASQRNGANGGSGGGGADQGSTYGIGGSPLNAQGSTPDSTAGEFGNAGGRGSSDSDLIGGGGGGAGTAGQVGGQSTGNGGAGKESTITGVSRSYAGGGGGGLYGGAERTGGVGGGGYGGNSGRDGGDGEPSTGGGGGGGGRDASTPNPGGNGGSGVVIVSYLTAAANGTDDLAMSFNGTNQYGTIATASPNNFISTNDITIEAWVYPTSSSGQRPVVFRQDAFAIKVSNGNWSFEIGNYAASPGTFTFITGPPVQLNAWTHVALTRSGTAVAAYVDGQAVASATQSAVMPDASNVEVGSFLAAGEFFEGRIDEVRIFSDARTVTEIVQDMHTHGPVSTANLVAYYDFNEGTEGGAGTGTVLNHAAGATSATNLTTQNNPTYVDVKTVDTATVPGEAIVTFPRSYLTAAGGWQVPTGVTDADALIVGGGGGGGGERSGGGGGGGGVKVYTADAPISAGNIEPVIVGQGGRGSGVNGGDGQSSTLGTARVGGGGGGARWTQPGRSAPTSADFVVRGSGGGGNQAAGGSGAFSGGTGSGTHGNGGGGGGATANGQADQTTAGAGDGGAGRSSSIATAGPSVVYGSGGGGGGAGYPGGAGGDGAGDGKNLTSQIGGSGLPNRGGGGGGGGGTLTSGAIGGSGGSGVVIVRYSTANLDPSCTPEETQYTADGTTYRVVAFKDTGSCEWTVPAGVTSVDYLVVGGGGGGAFSTGGGGGAGGRRTGTESLTAGATATVLVGSGGSGGVSTSAMGGNGANSNLTGAGFDGVAAVGGGGGGSSTVNGLPGGSGGGGGGYNSVGGAPESGQGFIGGGGAGGGVGGSSCGNGTNSWCGGGGGGAGGAGSSVVFNSGMAGAGGIGAETTWLTPAVAVNLGIGQVEGSSVYFAGGGGGAATSSADTPGQGGLGGGGTGADQAVAATAGRANTGGGGGGGSTETSGQPGGSGVVVLRYVQQANTACTPLTYSYDDYVVLEFQGTGTCDWTVPTGVGEVDVLAVGGGGGGGAWVGGGGGGGGVTASSNVTVTPSSAVPVTVGVGGRGAHKATDGSLTQGTSGAASSFGSSAAVTALGGGVGASWDAQASGAGSGVATGGGGAQMSGTYAGGAGASSSGGSAAADAQPHAVGGGGGAGGDGSSGTGSGNSWASGAGGVGVGSSITGTSVYYGGGGGGSAHGTWTTPTSWDTSIVITPGSGGLGGGAAGGAVVTDAQGTDVSGADGTDGLGGGGGGGANAYYANTTYTSTGGDGGDGVVIVRYSTLAGAPTAVTGEATAANVVTASWTAPTHTGGSPITDYDVVVSVDGGAFSAPASGTCTTAMLTATTCTVTSATAGATYAFKVTANTSSGAGTQSDASTAVTAFGPLDGFTVTATDGGAIGSQIARASFDIMVTAQDSGGRTVTDFAGTVDLTSTSTISAGGGTTAAFTAGVLASHAITLSSIGSQTITATRTGSSETGTSGSITVGVGAPATMTVSAGDNQSATVATAVSTAPAVEVLDGPGNPVPGVSVTFDVVGSNWATFLTPPSGTVAGTYPSVQSEFSVFKVTPTGDACVTSASSVLDSANASSYSVNIYADSSGSVGSLVGTLSQSNSGSATVTYSGAVALSSGTPYWVGVRGSTVGYLANVHQVTGTQSSTWSWATTGTNRYRTIDSGATWLGFSTVNVPTLTLSGQSVASCSQLQGSGSLDDSGMPVSSVTVTTDANGIATSPEWTLDESVGANYLRASTTGVSPVTFTANGTAQAITIDADDVTIDYLDPVTTAYTLASGSLIGSNAISSVTYSYSGSGTTSYGPSTTPPTNAGTYTITPTAVAFSSGSVSNYDITYTTGTLTISKINQAALSITSSDQFAFGDSVTLATVGGSGTGAVRFSVVGGSATGCIISGTTLTYSSTGTCDITADRAGDGNYNAAAQARQTVTISRAGQTLAFTSTVPAAPVSGGTYTPTAQAVSTVTGSSSGIAPTFAVSGTCSIANGVVTFTASGDCVVTASASSNTNFTAATDVVQTIAVGSINQNITFPQPSSASFGSASVAMGATASSGLTVTYAVGAGTTNSACSVSSLGMVTILAVGVCEVVARQAGDAQYAAASDVTRAFQVMAAVPTAPTITSASAGNESITVGIAAPGFTGGVAIDGYRVVATPTGSGNVVTSTSCTASPCTINGLVNGTEYTVAAQAINSAGTGATSGDSTPLTPATAAFAVTALAATPGDTIVDVSWTSLTAAQLGGGSFTRYDVSHRLAGTGAYTAVTCYDPSSPSTLSTMTDQTLDGCRVTGLDNGLSYDFRVTAITTANALEIPGNTAEVVQYPSTVPSAPRTLTILASTPTDVQFSWEAPLSDGGAAITGYTVTVTSASTGATSPVTCAVAGLITNCTVSNLTNGAVYEFAVEATNRMSTGSNGNVATATYNVPSSDSSLSALVVTGDGAALALSPAFGPSTTTYAVEVANDIESVTVTPTATRAASMILVNGSPVASGSASSAIALDVGSNEITVLVTASDNRFTTEYTVRIERAAAVVVEDDPVDESSGDTTPVPQPAGDDAAPTIPSGLPPAASKGLAVYVDGDGTVRPAAFTVLETTGPNPILVAGDAGDLVMTIRGVGADTTDYDERSENFVAYRGTRLVVSGAGYAPGSNVEVWLFSTPTLLGSATAGADGSWTLEVRVPADAEIGEHAVQAEGTAAGGDDRSVRATLLIADPTPVMTLPESGADLDMMNYSILIGALGAMLAIIATGTRRRCP